MRSRNPSDPAQEAMMVLKPSQPLGAVHIATLMPTKYLQYRHVLHLLGAQKIRNALFMIK
jgi:hypothetical protein